MQFDLTDITAVKEFLDGYSFDVFRSLPATLSAEEAACALRVSVMTIKRLIDRRELKNISPGVSEIAKKDLVSFINNHFFAEFPIEFSSKNPEISQIVPKNPD